MLKKLLLAAVLAAPMCLFAQNKIGSVNSQDVFMLMPEVKTAQTTLQEVSKKYDTEFKALQGEFEKKLAEYQALAKDTPESIRQRREGELQELQAKISRSSRTRSSTPTTDTDGSDSGKNPDCH